jgi:hypothetical protein
MEKSLIEQQIEIEVKRLGYLGWKTSLVNPCIGEPWHQIRVHRFGSLYWYLGCEGTIEKSLLSALKMLNSLTNP